VKPGKSYYGLIHGEGHEDFLCGLQIEELVKIGEFSILSIANTSQHTVIPANALKEKLHRHKNGTESLTKDWSLRNALHTHPLASRSYGRGGRPGSGSVHIPAANPPFIGLAIAVP